jgi:hypothetical protein
VHSAWEDTAINYCGSLWQCLLRSRGIAVPEASPETSLEQWSQRCFNEFVCRVWARISPSTLCRLVDPVSVDLSGCDKITDAGLQHLTTLQHLQMLETYSTAVTDDGLAAFWDSFDEKKKRE